MRFDNFLFFWNDFESFFTFCGISKSTIRDIFKANFSDLMCSKEYDNELVGKIIEFNEVSTGEVYYAYSNNSVYICPKDTSLDSSKEKVAVSFIPFDNKKNCIDIARIKDGFLCLEEFDFSINELEIKMYDSDAVDLLATKGIKLENISVLSETIEKVGLIPDKEILISSGLYSVKDAGVDLPDVDIKGSINTMIPFYAQAVNYVYNKPAKVKSNNP